MRSLIASLLIATTAFAQTPPPAPVPAPAAEPQPAPAVVPATDEFSKAVFFGKKFFDMKDYAAAYQQFAKADALQADNPAVLYDMALLLAKAGRYSEATTKLDRYNQLYPSGAEKAVVTRLQLELEFQRELQKKRQSDQDYGELFTRGRFLYVKNDLDAALKLFQDAEQKRPNDPSAVYNQAVVYEKLGDYAKAIDRYHRYEELDADAEHKTSTDQHLLNLESELSDMRTKIVCAFCGLRLPIGAVWCPRCWRGPYLTSSAVWNSRPCAEGASATRATYYSDDRFAKNDTLPCSYSGTMLEALRYSPAKQHAIQDSRKSDGWTYNGDIIQGWRDRDGNEIRYVQGVDSLEHVTSSADGQILNYVAHKAGDSGIYLLDREDVVVENQKYTSHYVFDANNRIAQQQVEYQNSAGCDHVINMTADYIYEGEALAGARIKGGYDGPLAEGSPHVEWVANVTFAYDANGRLAKEDLAIAPFSKTYTKKAVGNLRDEITKIYPAMRWNRPIENVIRTGDLCGTNGNQLLGNPIDLRPFYAISPNVAFLIPYGVAKSNVTFTYPESFRLR